MRDDAFFANEKELEEIKRGMAACGDDDGFAVRLANSILDLKAQRDWLLAELHHYKPYRRLYDESVMQSIANSQDTIAKLFAASIDPNGVIAHGRRAMAEKQEAA